MSMMPMGKNPFDVLGDQQFAIPQQQLQMPAPKKKGGMFGGNAMQALAGGLAAFSAGMGSPAGAAVLQDMLRRRAEAGQAEAEAAQYEKQREDGYQDWVRRETFKAQNPSPVNNDTISDFNFIRDQLGEDAAKQYLRNLGDPMVTTVLPGNRVYSGPRSQMGAALGGGGAPAPALKRGHVEDGFELIDEANPGNPKSWRPVGQGGPTQPASGGFPR